MNNILDLDKDVLTQDIGMKPSEAEKFMKMIEETIIRNDRDGNTVLCRFTVFETVSGGFMAVSI